MQNYPYGVIRLFPGMYRKVIIDSQISLAHLRFEFWQFAAKNNLRCCLVLDSERCIYFEPDGSKVASDKRPDGGFVISVCYDDWIREDGL